MSFFNRRFGRINDSNQIKISEESLRKILVEENIDTPTIVNIFDKIKAECRYSFLENLIASGTIDLGSNLSIDPGFGVTLDSGNRKNTGTIRTGLGLINKQHDLEKGKVKKDRDGRNPKGRLGNNNLGNR